MSDDCLVQETLAEAEEHRNASQLREQRLAQQLAKNELDRQALSQVPIGHTKLSCCGFILLRQPSSEKVLIMQDLASAQQAANSLQGSSGAQTQALQQKQAEVLLSAC